MDAKIKAILIAEGSAEIDTEMSGSLSASVLASKSTAGPSAGVASFFFESNGHRVRLDAVNDPEALLKVRRLNRGVAEADHTVRVVDAPQYQQEEGWKGDAKAYNSLPLSEPPATSATSTMQSVQESVSKDSRSETGEVAIYYGEKELVRGRIEPALLHCPGQAYITMSESCVFDCAFCPVPKLAGRTKSVEEIVEMVDRAYRTGELRAIAITSGIERSPEEEVARACAVVELLTEYNVPIGVSVYPTSDSSPRLRAAGAVEVKYNVETMDRRIFKRACADMDLDFVLAALGEAVAIFGRNRVFSNFIIGLGESDETVKSGVRELAGLGVIPILRALNPHPLRPDLKDTCPDARRPDANRLLRLAQFEREILDACGLRGDVAETMCLPCGGCDLVPHRDV